MMASTSQFRIIRIDVQAFSCRKWHTHYHVFLRGKHVGSGGDTVYTRGS